MYGNGSSWVRGSQSRVTPDGELWATETERESDVFAFFSASAIDETKYIILIDRDNPDFPHNIQNQSGDRIDVTSSFFSVDAAVNSNGIFKLGVIRRVDGTDADIWNFLNTPFLATTTQINCAIRGVPCQIKLDLSGSQLLHGITNSQETSVSDVNTGLSLDSPIGASTVVPSVGDVVAKLEHVSGGAYNMSIFLFYHAHRVI